MLSRLMALGFGTAGSELASRDDIRNPGTDSLECPNATHLVPVSKSPDVVKFVKKVEVWILPASGYPVQQKVDLGGGDYRLVAYSHIEINPNMPRSALELPKSARRLPIR